MHHCGEVLSNKLYTSIIRFNSVMLHRFVLHRSTPKGKEKPTPQNKKWHTRNRYKINSNHHFTGHEPSGASWAFKLNSRDVLRREASMPANEHSSTT